MPKDYDGIAPWEAGLPTLEEYTDGWFGCSICLSQWTHKITGQDLAREWRIHLMEHARGQR